MTARFPKANLFLLIIFVLFFSFSSFAQTLDQTFSPVLQDFGSSGDGFPTVSMTLVQPDGKILVGGKFTVANGVARSKIARFNANYSLDTTFDAADLAADEDSSFGAISVIKLQPDGKILIGGNFRFENPNVIRAIARLNADGSIDSSFQSQIIDSGIGDIEIQPELFTKTSPASIKTARLKRAE